MTPRDEILELAELIDAPVVAFRSGRGIVSNAHELGLTMAAAYRLWPQTDLMIGIGTRLELPTMSRWPFKPDGLKSVRIDIDPSEMRRFTPDAAVIADAQAGTRELLAAVRKRGYTQDRAAAAPRSARPRRRRCKQIQQVQPQMAYLNILREVLPPNAIVTDELSQVGFASWYGFPVYQPRTFITSGYQGTLGSGFPTALGAKVAHPDRPVVAITGDGGFMFGVQELATAVQFNIGVVTLVFNNNAYGNVRRDQRERFDGRVVASDLVNPDFVKLAESFGVGAARVTSPETFRPALEKALADGGPYVIAIEVPKGLRSQSVDVHSSGEAVARPLFPSPPVGEGAFAKRRRMRGSGPSIGRNPSSGSPPLRVGNPPSPARGEGRNKKCSPRLAKRQIDALPAQHGMLAVGERRDAVKHQPRRAAPHHDVAVLAAETGAACRCASIRRTGRSRADPATPRRSARRDRARPCPDAATCARRAGSG